MLKGEWAMSSPEARVSVSWPTEAETVGATRLFSPYQEVIERLVWRVRDAVRAHEEDGWEPEPPPTLETVGVLFDLADALRLDGNEILGLADQLDQATRDVNALRLDLECVAKRTGDHG